MSEINWPIKELRNAFIVCVSVWRQNLILPLQLFCYLAPGLGY